MPTKLLLDIDTAAMPKHFDRRLFRIVDLLGLRVLWWNLKRSRRGWHVVILVRQRLEPAMVVALQMWLGSDMAREAFNLARLRSLATMPAYWKTRWQTLYGNSWYPFDSRKGRRS